MLYTVTNGSRHPRVVYAAGRGVLVPMGASRPVEMSEAEAENAKAEGVSIEVGEAMATPTAAPPDDPAAAAAELLAKVSDMQWLSFKAAASKLLGDGAPSTKAEIIAALEEKARA
jgi:hypothetical protein